MEKKRGLEVKRPGSLSKSAFTQRTCIRLGKDRTYSSLILSKCRYLTNLTLIYQSQNAIQIKTQLHIMLRKYTVYMSFLSKSRNIHALVRNRKHVAEK